MSTDPRTAAPAGPAMRADAQRNRMRILHAALEAFASDGRLVPLDEIARRAGVGAGTVYRHFATKEALFEAVVSGRIEEVVVEGRALLADDDPGEAFYGFFGWLVERAVFNHGLCEGLAVDEQSDRPFEAEFTEVLGALLARAQERGAVRGDVDAGDVRALMSGCVVMERQRRVGGPPGRMVALACESLRVTKPLTPARNETSVRNETRSGTGCEICGTPLKAARTGRPARFCGPTCRQKAHRRRRP